LKCHELQRLIRAEWEQQKHFPLPLATSLSRSFASHGLHFFKVNKTVTHVAVARPQYLDLDASPVSESIKRIVTYINEHPKCTRRKMVEALAPAPKVTVIEVAPDAPKAPAPDQAEPTPEQTALIADLHWLVHQGHVLEFADGKLETAKKPAPKPVKEPKSQPKAAAAPSPAAPGTPEPVTESVADIITEATTPPAPVETTLPVADVSVAPELADEVPVTVPEAVVPLETPVVPALPVAVAEAPNQNVSVPPVS
jgi:hypothetical protein